MCVFGLEACRLWWSEVRAEIKKFARLQRFYAWPTSANIWGQNVEAEHGRLRFCPEGMDLGILRYGELLPNISIASLYLVFCHPSSKSLGSVLEAQKTRHGLPGCLAMRIPSCAR